MTSLKTLLALAMVASTLTAVSADGAFAACKRGNPNCLPSGGGPKFRGGTTNPSGSIPVSAAPAREAAPSAASQTCQAGSR
jgi:hypothetical protein